MLGLLENSSTSSLLQSDFTQGPGSGPEIKAKQAGSSIIRALAVNPL